MQEFYLRLVRLPPHVEATVLPNQDGTFDIYVNESLPEEQQRRAFDHEVRHIQLDHLYNCDPVSLNELEADGKRSSAAAPPAPEPGAVHAGPVLPEPAPPGPVSSEPIHADPLRRQPSPIPALSGAVRPEPDCPAPGDTRDKTSLRRGLRLPQATRREREQLASLTRRLDADWARDPMGTHARLEDKWLFDVR